MFGWLVVEADKTSRSSVILAAALPLDADSAVNAFAASRAWVVSSASKI